MRFLLPLFAGVSVAIAHPLELRKRQDVTAINASDTLGLHQVPTLKDPYAKDASKLAPGYSLVRLNHTKHGLQGLLTLNGDPADVYGHDYEQLELTVSYQEKTRLNVRIEPKDPYNPDNVFVLPDSVVSLPKTNLVNLDESDLVFKYTESPFKFSVIRKRTGDILFSTQGPLVFETQFIEFSTKLPKDHYISGLGETLHGSRLEPGANRTLYAADIANHIDINMYGVHPVYYDQRWFEENGAATHAVWLRNSAPQEILIREESLTWRTISGILDLYFFAGGDSPYEAIEQYVSAVGLPAFHQYWTLGLHQCRWGYDTLQDMEDVVNSYRKFNIPLETLWSDLDYMDSKKDFTVDPHRYGEKEFHDFLERMHEHNQKYVPLVDAAVYASNPTNKTEAETYTPYSNGIKDDVFLKNPDGSVYYGVVWPGYTVFPDFFHPNTSSYWSNEIQQFHKKVPFDGLWNDMNEVSSFCIGSCGSGKLHLNPVQAADNNTPDPNTYPKGFENANASEYKSVESKRQKTATVALPATLAYPDGTPTSSVLRPRNTLAPKKSERNINYPPYVINNGDPGSSHDLAQHAMSPNVTHYAGLTEYDVHNVYSLMQVTSTYHALLNVFPNKRPFIISRSSFSGLGHVAGHWGGDNLADWPWAYLSITQAFAAGSFGIPFFGVDACGFTSDSDEELCNRWMQLASFFPFYRNHNTKGTIPQEPYQWKSVAEATKKSVEIRYLLLPHYYTLLHESHTTGRPMLRQLQWEFYGDRHFAGIDNQFLVGSHLLVTPVLEPGVDKVRGVFPEADTNVWYDWYTQKPLDVTDPRKNTTLDAPLGHINLHIRGGAIFPTQEPGYTTTESRQKPYGVIAALDRYGNAKGQLYLDDGESVQVDSYKTVAFSVKDKKLMAVPTGEYNPKPPLANVTILGVHPKPDSVSWNDKAVSYDWDDGVLNVHGLTNETSAGAWAECWSVSW